MAGHDWTKGLNPQQAEAVLHTQGPLLILAGAGSGKTTVLVSRTGHLISNVKIDPNHICVLTFTNKAARELKHRVSHRLGSGAQGIWSGTFHSFGLQILRRYHRQADLPSHFGVIDQGDAEGILKELAGTIKNSAKESFRIDRLLEMINAWRSVGRKKAQNPADEYEIMAEVLLPKYLRRLETLGVVDFEALLLRPLQLFQTRPEILSEMQDRYRHVMVDEFQDTNSTQFRLVQAISLTHQNLAVVGDDDQSIYGWRGACIENILDFPKHFSGCRVIRLESNYRSTPAILSLANNIIEKNAKRHGKVLRPNPNSGPGSKPELFVYDNDDVEIEEVVKHIISFRDQGIPLNDVAVLYRSNSQGALLEAALRRENLKYSITGGVGFFDRKETKDVLAYLRSALKPNEISLRRILNTPHRGIGETTVDRISGFARDKQVSFLSALRKAADVNHSGPAGLDVGERAARSIQAFLDLLDGLVPRLLAQTREPDAVGRELMAFLNQIGYRDHIRGVHKSDEVVSSRWQVLEILAQVLNRFVEQGGASIKTLHEFIDSMDLRDQPDEQSDGPNDSSQKVQLLTLHACKGLEFRAVVLMGLEEDLLPHRVLGGDVSEERRLFYVGVTRAKEHLVLTRARTRKKYGKVAPVTPSRFLEEIQPDLIVKYESGYRPLGATQRQSMLDDLRKRLDQSIASQKIDR